MQAFGLSDHYREIFEITRLADFMTITDDEDRAVSGAEGRQRCLRQQPRSTCASSRSGACVIDIKGDITAQSEDVLMDAYGRASGRGREGDRPQLQRTSTYMNSGGIGLLVTLLVRAQRQHQRVLAYGLSDHYRQIFELTRLDEAVGIHDSEQRQRGLAG